MTVGARFISPSLPHLFPFLPSLMPSLPSLLFSIPLPHSLPLPVSPPCLPSYVFLISPSLFLVNTYPLNPAREFWGSAVSSPSGSGQSPAAKRFWCIFRLKSALL